LVSLKPQNAINLEKREENKNPFPWPQAESQMMKACQLSKDESERDDQRVNKMCEEEGKF